MIGPHVCSLNQFWQSLKKGLDTPALEAILHFLLLRSFDVSFSRSYSVLEIQAVEKSVLSLIFAYDAESS